MINIFVYTLVSLTSLSFITVIAADIADPCPINVENIHDIADMCTDDSVEEDSVDGGKIVDSVLLRITKKQNNCICHVSLQNTVTNYTIYMSKYDYQSSAAPENQNCGLAVDVDQVDPSDTTLSLESIECTGGTSLRSIALGRSKLILQSRIINGNFIRGYCMQIYRNQSKDTCKMTRFEENKIGSDLDWFKAIQNSSYEECEGYCLENKLCVAVAHHGGYCYVYNQTTLPLLKKDHSVYLKKHCDKNIKLKIRCYPSESTTLTSRVTTTEDNHSTKIDSVTKPTSDKPVTNSKTQSTMKIEKEEDKSSDLYVYLGAAAGGVLMILLIVCIIVCIRKRSNQTSLKDSNNDSKKQFCSEARDSDNDYGGLKDNVLYVSSEPSEILEDGNYNTVDLEQTLKVNQDISLDGNYSTVDGICSNSSLSKSKPVIKPKPKTNSSLKRESDEETIHLSTMDNSNNEYAVVDKGRNSDALKHINPVHGNDTEYAVVNKVKRSSNNK